MSRYLTDTMRHSMGRHRIKKAKFLPDYVKVSDNPNFKQYLDTDFYISRLGDVYKIVDGEDVKVHITIDTDGSRYFYIKRKKVNLPRALYKTFVGDIPKGYVVGHKNGFRGDNKVSNLYICTVNELLSRYRGKTSQVRYIQDLKTGKIYKGISEAMRGIGYSKNQVIDICKGRVRNPQIPLRYLDERPYGKVE